MSTLPPSWNFEKLKPGDANKILDSWEAKPQRLGEIVRIYNARKIPPQKLAECCSYTAAISWTSWAIDNGKLVRDELRTPNG